MDAFDMVLTRQMKGNAADSNLPELCYLFVETMKVLNRTHKLGQGVAI